MMTRFAIGFTGLFLTTTLWCPTVGAASKKAVDNPASVSAVFTLAPFSLSQLENPACSETVLAAARKNGLKFSDRPSIGSGLAKAGPNEFWGLTDRGPNGNVASDEDTRRIFPLPQFCPTIVRFKLVEGRIHITQSIPLRDRQGKLISGLSNSQNQERLHESSGAHAPLPVDPNGVDPEAIRVLPDGNFLLSEEYSPSILVVSATGEVLVRYTPASEPLINPTYPVKPILPAVLAKRRVNRGFENLALSGDGQTAYAILQSPMGDPEEKKFAASRMIRAIKLDVREPLNAKVVGEYLVPTSPAAGYSKGQKQDKIGWSDAEWIAPDQLLVIERGKREARLLRVDLRRATNLLGRQDEAGFVYENAQTDLQALGIRTAETHQVFSTRGLPVIDSDKIEGLAVLSPTEIALSNDNDFGIGENLSGESSKVWIVQLPGPVLGPANP